MPVIHRLLTHTILAVTLKALNALTNDAYPGPPEGDDDPRNGLGNNITPWTCHPAGDTMLVSNIREGAKHPGPHRQQPHLRHRHPPPQRKGVPPVVELHRQPQLHPSPTPS